MKKILLTTILIFSFIFLSECALAAQVILRPNGAGTYTQWTIGGSSPAPTNWESVDESTADDDVTYVSTSSASVNDTYALSDSGLSSEKINFVEVWIRARKAAGAPTAATFIRTNSQNYEGTQTALGASYTDMFTNYTVNPNTGSAWTVAQVNALEAGERYGTVTKEGMVTQVWVVVNYAPIDTTPPQWSNNITSPSPATYTPSQSYQFNVTWQDPNTGVSKVLIEHNFTGAGPCPANCQNYTVSNQDSVWYYTWTDLPAGTYAWKEYANNTDNYWNTTNNNNYWYYTVQKGASNVTLFINKTEGNKNIVNNTGVNITVVNNVTGTTVWMTTNRTNWYESSNPTPYENTTELMYASELGANINVTGWWNGNQNYTSDNQTYYITIKGLADCTFSLAFPATYSGSLNESIDVNKTAVNWISFNFTVLKQNWTQPWTNGIATNNQDGSLKPIFLIYNTGNTDITFMINATVPSNFQLCANSTCAGGDCSENPTTCTALTGSFVGLGTLYEGKKLNVTLYANMTNVPSAGQYAGDTFIVSQPAA